MFISEKKIKGVSQHYLEESIRLPNGVVKKLSVYIKKKDLNGDLKKYENLLEEKKNQLIINSATKYYKTDYIFNLSTIEKLEKIKLRYKEIVKKLSKKQLADVLDRFAINFTYESNAIEGNSLTLKEITVVLHENRAIEGKNLREIYETINTRLALDLIFKGKFKINQRDIINLHKVLVKDTGIVFGYKKIPNFLLGRNIETTLPENVEREMTSLISWYKKNNRMHPLRRAAIFHGRFEKIHPFEDGNGRCGRLLINIILLENGYSPLIIRKSQRLSYFNALEAFDNKYYGKLIRFLIDKYKDTYEKFFEVYVKYLR